LVNMCLLQKFVEHKSLSSIVYSCYTRIASLIGSFFTFNNVSLGFNIVLGTKIFNTHGNLVAGQTYHTVSPRYRSHDALWAKPSAGQQMAPHSIIEDYGKRLSANPCPTTKKL
ncbi:MAG: hypothetical protein SPG95_04785, partial [Bacteroidaceae bacterium]|nr:hypothetical protein [Bacteroidaceae bacterium]